MYDAIMRLHLLPLHLYRQCARMKVKHSQFLGSLSLEVVFKTFHNDHFALNAWASLPWNQINRVSQEVVLESTKCRSLKPQKVLEPRSSISPKWSLYSALEGYLRSHFKSHKSHFWLLVFRGLYQDDQLIRARSKV